ncbi:type II toxin-antitoxin system RelE/ParE family toxin [Caenimonas aquaedulcis]|uniref:Type II toxin-antitoxin system RelE/ParE family toxin n=1 Tax=Caenimonas aquaedulcis TaxID=2793270 RepID=A0A931H365_9BURK|nr:type II toxin-antitoxin system RelE/ParE family toxin [Caenimonas aquaedulcis]MBG9387741.1 type II toxin-antitoxin system RelE/ParE family toxin [Caenimonas aquaedulcis]
MNVRLLAPAQVELDEAVIRYAEQAPGLGDAFLIEVMKVFNLIAQFPQAWHPLAPDVRRCRLNRFPYSVVYSNQDDDVVVLAIAHQHRSPTYWRNR